MAWLSTMVDTNFTKHNLVIVNRNIPLAIRREEGCSVMLNGSAHRDVQEANRSHQPIYQRASWEPHVWAVASVFLSPAVWSGGV